MKTSGVLVCLIPVSLSTMAFAGSDAVARYGFDEGNGPVVRDLTGNGHDGKIIGARFVKSGTGGALSFDGVDDDVDCGTGGALDLREQITIAAWVRPARVPPAEVGLVIKDFESYGLTYYKDGYCYFYISGGGNHCKAPIAPGFWFHVAGTYDGQVMRLYINGKLRAHRKLAVGIKKGPTLRIGSRGVPGSYFAGRLDEVQIHRRALSAEQVRAIFERQNKIRLAQRRPVRAAEVLRGEGFSVRVGRRGALQIDVGGDAYLIESAFSYPAPTIGMNVLSEEDPQAEEGWTPAVARAGPDEVRVTAVGSCYSLTRRIRAEGHRLSVADRLTCRSSSPVGLIVEYRTIMGASPTQPLLAGVPEPAVSQTAENPTMFLFQPRSRLGLIAEDTVLRLQFEASAYGNQATFAVRHLAIKPGETRTLRWTAYPMGPEGGYFDFVNAVRRDWKTNFTLPGPWGFLSVIDHWDTLRNPAKLKAYLARNRLKVVALMPWLDYDHFNDRTGKTIGRAEYKRMMRHAMQALKAADPEIKCTGCMEGNLVSLPEEAMRVMYETLPKDRRKQGVYLFTDRLMELVKDVKIRWKDCLLAAPDGRYRYELYYRGPKRQHPLMAIAVYAAKDNDQQAYWLDQARFMLEDVGLDGIYIDQFSLAFNAAQRYSYDRWDGVTVDIDPGTGKIARRYTDGALVGVPARKALIEYVLSRGGVMVTNTHCAVEELQRYPIARFMEAEGACNPLTLEPGQEPPLARYMCKGHFDGPVALGCRPYLRGDAGLRDYAKVIMNTVITYLRHGLVFYHYNTEIPETGPASGEYGPINHMFPITPIALHKGWIEGEERIVTAVSGTYRRPGKRKPTVHVFDNLGRKAQADVSMTQTADGWQIKLKLKDWQQIAVVASSGH